MSRDIDQQILTAAGWSLVQQSPLELRHIESDSVASGIAALIVIDYLSNKKATENLEQIDGGFDSLDNNAIMKLLKEGLSFVFTAERIATSLGTPSGWNIAFIQVFSALGARRIRAGLNSLNISFDYSDPDSSYQDDVIAYANALRLMVENNKDFYPELATLNL